MSTRATNLDLIAKVFHPKPTGNNMKTNDEIIEAAKAVIATIAAIDEGKFEDEAAAGAAFYSIYGGFDRDDYSLVTVAEKILGGRPYFISSDNPEKISRARSLAGAMGATVEENAEHPMLPNVGNAIRILPPEGKAA